MSFTPGGPALANLQKKMGELERYIRNAQVYVAPLQGLQPCKPKNASYCWHPDLYVKGASGLRYCGSTVVV